MTNPISKAIVKAAVAMGYGKKSDYKGSSVADVLEKFAAIAKDKGGSSGGYEPYVVEIEGIGTENMTTDADFTTAKTKFLANEPVLFRLSVAGMGTYILQVYAFSTTEGKETLAANIDRGTDILFHDNGSISET
jgi:hypothetical protein